MSEILDMLREPFPPAAIKQRKQGGRQVDYVQGADVVNRLLDVWGLGWSWCLSEYKIESADGKDFAIVTGELRFMGNGWSAIGSAPVLKGDLENAYKSAGKDALKVAASLVGVALHLYPSHHEAEAGKGVSHDLVEHFMAMVHDCPNTEALNALRAEMNQRAKSLEPEHRADLKNAIQAKQALLQTEERERFLDGSPTESELFTEDPG